MSFLNRYDDFLYTMLCGSEKSQKKHHISVARCGKMADATSTQTLECFKTFSKQP
ncbi:hypothetical protein [Helicobacter cetorum]|uniref:hypothetical protein n=1 Tax=Helicobacter cetorum TaxID=138563 RepID=UPI0013151E5C|nr:hypothetical protein [Helicobacter cetorum]